MSEVTFVTWAELPQVDIVPGVRRRHLSGDNVMLVQVTLDDGAVVRSISIPMSKSARSFPAGWSWSSAGRNRGLAPARPR